MKVSPDGRRKRLIWIFLFIWSIAIVMSLPNLFLLTLHPHIENANSFLCGLSDHYAHSKWILVYKYLESVFFFFIPICLQVSVNDDDLMLRENQEIENVVTYSLP